MYLLERSDALFEAGLEVLGVSLGVVLAIVFGFLLPLIILFVGVGALVCVIASDVDGSDLPS